MGVWHKFRPEPQHDTKPRLSSPRHDSLAKVKKVAFTEPKTGSESGFIRELESTRRKLTAGRA